MEKQFIKDLKEKESIHSVFLASDKVVQTDKNGKSFISVNLSDRSGLLNARIWENVAEIERAFQSGDVVKVKGVVQLYQNRRQIVIYSLKKAEPSQYKLNELMQGPDEDPKVILGKILEMVKQVKDTNIKQMLELVLNDAEIEERLLKAPAAKTIHHAYPGGLLEHIHSICKLMEFLASHYKFMNYDLLLFGAIFHDIGKVWELEVGEGIQYTDRGRLVGHMQIACELIDKTSEKILGFPQELKDILKHIVLSHHGKLEYGSPKRPKFIEALVVAMIDELDSRINTLYGFMKSEADQGSSWTKYHPGFDRYFYLDILNKK